MAKTFEYEKVVEGWRLAEELKAADFLVETVYSKYNADNPELSEPYCKVVLPDEETKNPGAIVEAHVPGQLTDEELYQAQLKVDMNEIHDTAILALVNWDSLTLAQKDIVLKNILKWALWKDGRLKLGVL
jgi:hypothetical protein